MPLPADASFPGRPTNEPSRLDDASPLTKADVETQFGGMYGAFQFGAPPHGGMAAGVDRIVMLVCGVQNLREIRTRVTLSADPRIDQ